MERTKLKLKIFTDFFLKCLPRFVVYLTSIGFALYTLTGLKNVFSGEVFFVVFGLTGFFLFVHFVLKKINKGRSKDIFFLIVIAFSLSVYMGSFFILELSQIWHSSLDQMPKIINFTVEKIRHIPISFPLFVILLLFGPIWFLKKYFKIDLYKLCYAKEKEYLKISDLSRYKSLIFFGILYITIAILTVAYFSGILVKIPDDKLSIYITSVIGFIPLHWIYELFITPFRK